MTLLTILTSIVNYIALAITVWLGWYVLTRSFNKPISWLTSLTLWSISGIFINTLLAMNPPTITEQVPEWVVFIFPFWDHDVLTHGANDWLLGWLVVPAAGFWHHVTMLIRTERLKTWQYIQVIVVYITTFLAILAIIRTPYMYTEISGNPLLLNTLKPGVLYSSFLVLLSIIILMSIQNLRQGIINATSILAKNQLKILAWATLIAGLTAPISFIAITINYSIPRVIISILLAISVTLIGVSIGKFSALIEGRLLRRDFVYSGAAMTIVALLYSLIIWLSVIIFGVPPAAYIFILIFAFATHTLIDTARLYLDKLFFRKEEIELRQNIRDISSRVRQQGIQETLELQLDLACTSVRASSGVIILFEGENNKTAARFQYSKDLPEISRDTLLTDDFKRLPSVNPRPTLEDFALLVPIYLEDTQLGAILLGPPVNSPHYPETDIDRLIDVSEQMAATINQFRLGKQLLEQAVSTMQIPVIETNNPNEIFSIENIEAILRNLHDYAFLGESEIASSKLVETRFPDNDFTYLDRGKIVHNIVEEAVARLRPDKGIPSEIPTREWYPYMILHQAYFEDKLNRDIMSYLYISEGTFNRTRRSAIRAVARALAELETQLQ